MERFIFADESAFPLQRITNNKEWQTKTTPKQITVKPYNPFVHAWGAISFHGKSQIKMLSSTQKWNSETIAETFKDNLIPMQETLYPDGLFFFVQDNARPHKYGACKVFLDSFCPESIVEQPAKSPDLNPIEKIWGDLKEEIYGNGEIEYDNRKFLKKAIQKAWDNLSLEKIRIHILDLFNKRLDRIIQSGGEKIN